MHPPAITHMGLVPLTMFCLELELTLYFNAHIQVAKSIPLRSQVLGRSTQLLSLNVDSSPINNAPVCIQPLSQYCYDKHRGIRLNGKLAVVKNFTNLWPVVSHNLLRLNGNFFQQFLTRTGVIDVGIISAP